MPGEHECFHRCGGKVGACPGHCGENGFCCSGEDPNNPNSWLSIHGTNGDCPQEAIVAQQNREDPWAGFACIAKQSNTGFYTLWAINPKVFNPNIIISSDNWTLKVFNP